MALFKDRVKEVLWDICDSLTTENIVVKGVRRRFSHINVGNMSSGRARAVVKSIQRNLRKKRSSTL